MQQGITRRQFSELAAIGLALPRAPELGAAEQGEFRIRTVTAGLVFGRNLDHKLMLSAINFLQQAKRAFESAGYEVQTLRLAAQAMPHYLPDWSSDKSLQKLRILDRIADEAGVMLSIGPVIVDDAFPTEFPAWATQLIQNTNTTSFSIHIASPQLGLHRRTIAAAAETITRIANSTRGGEGNFRFAATAFCPAGTPFFPAAWYDTPMTFSIGLETPQLLLQAPPADDSGTNVKAALAATLNRALAPVAAIAGKIGRLQGWGYLGMDTSPAPGLDASIGAVIEKLSAAPFGSASTLSTCALLTDVLKGLEIKSCGYSGLMLPVLEDKILAQRAAQGRYGVNELLLYSSVCGTGLDVVPLAGNISARRLSALIGDVAALANKYQKPLSARLFPVPGKQAGDAVSFDNPYLTDSVVMDA